jgi:hypothetical protein
MPALDGYRWRRARGLLTFSDLARRSPRGPYVTALPADLLPCWRGILS